jgi:hypothetical protein
LPWLKSTYAKESIAIAYFPPPSPEIVVKTEPNMQKRSRKIVPIALEHFSEEEDEEEDDYEGTGSRATSPSFPPDDSVSFCLASQTVIETVTEMGDGDTDDA